jgi:hypothetical protein
VDVVNMLIEPAIAQLLGNGSALDPQDALLQHLWHALTSPIYSEFLQPVWVSIIPSAIGELDGAMAEMVGVALSMLVLDMLVELVMLLHVNTVASHIRAVLRLMLGCPADMLIGSPKIMKVLSGDFSPERSDAINRDTEFLEAVSIALPDPVMYADSERRIRSADTACLNMFLGNDPVGQAPENASPRKNASSPRASRGRRTASRTRAGRTTSCTSR